MPPQHHVVEHREVGEQAQVLEGAAHAQAADGVRRLAHDVAAQEADHARVGFDHAGEHVDHGALAGAVRADECMDVAALQAERHVLRRLHAAVRLGHALHHQQLAFAAGTDLARHAVAGRPFAAVARLQEPLVEQAHHAARHHIQREQQ
ncbi:hypothetical protein D9M70_541150 [compost metagenome]